jgi:hypothetical protein
LARRPWSQPANQIRRLPARLGLQATSGISPQQAGCGSLGRGTRSVDRDPLNFFQPFERLPAGHENQLTRALLVALRLSPMAHECWLARAAPGRHVYELPSATFATQSRAVKVARNADEAVPLISVFLTPNEPLGEGVIVESDRGQVLDAIIDYGGELVMVVENKLGDDSDWQARELNLGDSGVRVEMGQQRQVVSWPDMIADVIGILERGLASGAEAGVLSDFLTFVENHFAALGPYRTLPLCGGDEFRISRRLRAVLSEAAAREAHIDKWGPTVELPHLPGTGSRAYLRSTPDPCGIELSLYPADTLSQAREFYTNKNVVAAVLKLGERPGWHVRPNFHFGHMEGGYAWCTTRIDTDRYIELWQERIGRINMVPRQAWDEYWRSLEQEGVASSEDRAEFDRHFTATSRSTATPRPGLAVVRRWEMTDAERMDGNRSFIRHVTEALRLAVASLSGTESAALVEPRSKHGD